MLGDMESSVAFSVSHGLLLHHVDKDIKHYVKTGELLHNQSTCVVTTMLLTTNVVLQTTVT